MTGASPPVVYIRELSHRYGKVSAVDGLELDVPAGCLAGLIGPDGVGKSTLLGLIAGARKIRNGAVQVLGGDMRSARFRRSAAPDRLHAAGAGPQSLRAASVFDNVDFFGRLFDQPARERRRRIDALLASTGLEPVPRSPGRQAFRRDEAETRAVLRAPARPGFPDPGRAHHRHRSAVAPSVLAAARPHREPASGDELPSHRLHGGSGILRLAGGHGRRAAPGQRHAAHADGRTGTATWTPPSSSSYPRPAGAAIAAQHPPRRASDGERPSRPPTSPALRRFPRSTMSASDIERGEIFGFLGSNGCGKTTTMKVTGLLPATGASAALRSRSGARRNVEDRRRVGYMSQGFSLRRS